MMCRAPEAATNSRLTSTLPLLAAATSNAQNDAIWLNDSPVIAAATRSPHVRVAPANPVYVQCSRLVVLGQPVGSGHHNETY